MAEAVVCRKGVLINIDKFTRKHLCQSLFFNKVADLRSATLLKMRLRRRCFPVNFANFLGTPFFYRTPPVAASKMELNSVLQCFPKLGIFKNQIHKLQNICGNWSRYSQNFAEGGLLFSRKYNFFLKIQYYGICRIVSLKALQFALQCLHQYTVKKKKKFLVQIFFQCGHHAFLK